MVNRNKISKMAEQLLYENELIEFKYFLLKKDSFNIQERVNANMHLSIYIKIIKKRMQELKTKKR